MEEKEKSIKRLFFVLLIVGIVLIVLGIALVSSAGMYGTKEHGSRAWQEQQSTNTWGMVSLVGGIALTVVSFIYKSNAMLHISEKQTNETKTQATKKEKKKIDRKMILIIAIVIIVALFFIGLQGALKEQMSGNLSIY